MNNTNIDQTIENLNSALRELIEVAHSPVAQEIVQFLEFRAKSGESNIGKGIIWSGEGATKQIVYNIKPERFFVSENLDLAKEKAFSVGGLKVLDQDELGQSVVKSNLRQVGRLKGLVVDGSVSINEYLYYNSKSDRLGIGTEEPNAALGVAENGVEVMLGSTENFHGLIGTYADNDLDIVTGNVPRITIKSNGNIDLGNPNRKPIQVKVNGSIAINAEVPDPSVDLHVTGAVRLNNKLHISASTPPTQGNYNIGDIVWNDSPRVGHCIGWVCLRAGSPGSWYPFGEIKEQNK
jgi:hypothetical protein